MKSPFPGMDPFIEVSDLWGDFHDLLIADLHRNLAGKVPEQYIVRLNSRSYLAIDEEDAHMRPDVSVKRRNRARSAGVSPTEGTQRARTSTLSVPVIMSAPLEIEDRETFVEIYDLRQDRQLVTGIEILSPSNKRYRSSGWDEYLRKRRAFMNGAANFVEIDLLRGGRRMPMRGTWPNSPYYVLLSRKDRAPRCEVWPAYSLLPLPRVPVPLSYGDADIEVDLQPMVDAIFERSRYYFDIDYRNSRSLALTAEEKNVLSKLTTRKSRKES
jgi:hypothetical protein